MKPNMNWVANQGKTLPTVLADVEISPELFTVHFSVEEPAECFRAEVKEDNGSSWEDSCVEIFLQNPANSAEYFNFETTSRGYLLAAHGPDRNSRTKLSQEQINSVVRTKELASVAGNLVCWGMTVQIPASLFGLSAFPVETEKPDFHRPEFFQEF